jgi:hypothetical protein
MLVKVDLETICVVSTSKHPESMAGLGTVASYLVFCTHLFL